MPAPHDSQLNQQYDVIVLGAGAAGLMCAAVAGQRHRRVLVLDHNDVVGRKILISGGGRCNFTNSDVSARNFVSENPHFAKSALSRFQPHDFLSVVNKYKIEHYEKKLGQLFCKNSAREIVKLLVDECNEAQVEWALGTQVKNITRIETEIDSPVFQLECNKAQYTCQSLVVATGGLSIPKIGASDFGYRIARQFGLKVTQTSAALDGFRLNAQDREIFVDLSGVSLPVIAETGGVSFEENILFTHAGLSGPVALQTSLYWKKGEALTINLFPNQSAKTYLEEKLAQQPEQSLKNALGELLTARFAQVFVENVLKFESKPLKQYNIREIEKIIEILHAWQIYPDSTVGYQKAEVTRGGVNTNEISSKTFEARKVSGLYFIGEVLDVTGWLGGYNFQWAWASGWAAGNEA